LYYACVKASRRYRWLDLDALLKAVLPDELEIEKINYFTARVSSTFDDPSKATRQDVYLTALRSHIPHFEAFFGKFSSHVVPMRMAAPVASDLPSNVRTAPPWFNPSELNLEVYGREPRPWTNQVGPRVDVVKFEEKGSDVNLAVQLLDDAWEKSCECAVVVSNDSDLAHALRLAKKHLKRIGVVTGQKQPTRSLRKCADFHRRITKTHIKKSQLPETIPGTTISRPPEWK